eukprot:47114_1
MNAYQLWRITANPMESIDPDKRVRIRRLFKKGRRRVVRPRRSKDADDTHKALRPGRHHLKTTDTILQRNEEYKSKPKQSACTAKQFTSNIRNSSVGIVGNCTKDVFKPIKKFPCKNVFKTTDTILQTRPQTSDTIQRSGSKYHRHSSPKRNKPSIKWLFECDSTAQDKYTSTKAKRKQQQFHHGPTKKLHATNRNKSRPLFTPIQSEKRNANFETRFNIFGF